jgi:hypothetical protein
VVAHVVPNRIVAAISPNGEECQTHHGKGILVRPRRTVNYSHSTIVVGLALPQRLQAVGTQWAPSVGGRLEACPNWDFAGLYPADGVGASAARAYQSQRRGLCCLRGSPPAPVIHAALTGLQRGTQGC